MIFQSSEISDLEVGDNAGARCVPAALVPRQRRRRFPERELLERIRQYEALLRQHAIPFQPLHPETSITVAAEGASSPSDGRTPETPRTLHSGAPELCQKRAVEARTTRNLWHALCQNAAGADSDSGDGSSEDEHDSPFFRDDENMEKVIKKVLDRTYQCDPQSSTGHLVFGSPAGAIALTTLHPDQTRIFRLWQVYLDNVNPLLKVTHTPSLQPRIIDAMSDLANISAPLEALLFGIYCISVLSLTEDQCQTLFRSPRRDLLAGYQFACRQALLNANVLQSCEHDCLVALFLYLLSVKSYTDPRQLSSMLAVAVHTAQRMGYHNESRNEKHPVLEAELRRRLWWSLVIFNGRVCETFNYRTVTLVPTWNCRTPLNLNDFDLLPGTKTVPPVHDKPTEALFICVRSEITDFIRHCPFHLDFTDPFLTTFVGNTGHRDLYELQETLERTFDLYDAANPLHFMTIWTARGVLARNMLLEHCSKRQQQYHHHHHQHQDAHHTSDPDPSIDHALAMLRCDTALLISPLTVGFRWHVLSHFPFLAYSYLAQHLPSLAAAKGKTAKRKQKTDEGGDEGNDVNERTSVVSEIWTAMADNFDARRAAGFFVRDDGDTGLGGNGKMSDGHVPLFGLFARVVLHAWDAVGGIVEVPRIIVSLRETFGEIRAAEGRREGSGLGIGVDDNGVVTTGPMNAGGDRAGVQGLRVLPGQVLDGYSDMLGDGGLGFMDPNHQMWPMIDWDQMMQIGI
ncbi:hypothetical protein C7999DRAFT_42465 [Corynascus novoguineensis]|uniref:Xylanolytic transcriptional activator regulatory domain-containing protein n=1 Tax=Corynascus novoguineensis TaxID=1126955 RepID=A0AAN7CPR2_9PEZI|nr:hypothetical protein C7999DRAFT_42465 [Corynascus novoguineensis]